MYYLSHSLFSADILVTVILTPIVKVLGILARVYVAGLFVAGLFVAGQFGASHIVIFQ